MKRRYVLVVVLAAWACNSGGKLEGQGGSDTPGADAVGDGDAQAGDGDERDTFDPPSWWLDAQAHADAPPADVPLGSDPCVPRGTPGDKPVGSPCTADEECTTGLCYDEAWADTPENGGFRFCTAACSGCTTPCNTRDAITAHAPTCFQLPSSGVESRGLFYPSVCLPICYSDAECVAASGGALTSCRRPKDFQGTFIGVAKSCFP